MHRSYLIKPVSSSCNMQCKYCFYNDEASHRDISNYGTMSVETMRVFIVQTLGLSDEITYAFQGGEPTLAGLCWFQKFVYEVETQRTGQEIHYSIQTNGIQLNQDWIDFFKQHDFLVGVSLDGFKANHNYFRGHYEEVMGFIELLKNNQVNYNILTVLTESLSQYPKELYDFYKQIDVKHVQLIACLPELYGSTAFSLNPQSFYNFYRTFFQCWYEDLKQGHYISVSFFDQLLTLFSGKVPNLCGMLGKCSVQYVIEANGNVYPCDFYCLDQYYMGNIHDITLKEMHAVNFINEEKKMFKDCPICKFRKLCGGNCKRMNVTMFDDEQCYYQMFLEETYQIFYQLAKYYY